MSEYRWDLMWWDGDKMISIWTKFGNICLIDLYESFNLNDYIFAGSYMKDRLCSADDIEKAVLLLK